MLTTSAGAGSRALWRAPAQAQAAARRVAVAAASTSSRAGRPERSERLERLERPERPERPERSGRSSRTPYSSPAYRRLASAVLASAAADPRGGSAWQQQQQQQQNSARSRRGPIVLAVPVLPPADNYTDMGHDVVMPRTSALRPLPAGAKTATTKTTKTTATTATTTAVAESSGGLRVRYGKQHVLHPWSMRYLEATPGLSGSVGDSQLPHCLAELTRRRYAAKSAVEPLWWFVLVHTDSDLPIKSVYVRLAMRRRVQRAFREALRRHGYDKTGVAIEGGVEGGERRKEAQAPERQLYGSVRIEGTVRPLLKTAFEPLVAHLERVVGTLEQLLAVSPRMNVVDGRSISGSRTTTKITKITKITKTSSTRPQSLQATPRDAFDLLEPSHF